MFVTIDQIFHGDICHSYINDIYLVLNVKKYFKYSYDIMLFDIKDKIIMTLTFGITTKFNIKTRRP